ncbi:MBL fold metallo-hydrolase [Cytophagaceae bacterium ABcell3]|nr:MBL fold metallo-hydrolase [Cytophagaceae bacterium ABcell3]
MKVEQIYTKCLSQMAYYLISGKEAAVIDPLRDIKPYLDRAEKDGVKIKYVFETHFHADFVSGHLDLARETGATIVYGTDANPKFNAHIAEDCEEFQVGETTLRVLHTPGHTLESVCYLLKDKFGKEQAVFTGDTLFVGDVGRPDLAQDVANMTKEQLASLLYNSLHEKLMPLPEHVLVYPGHGAGSACGKNISKETVSTIGEQQVGNYAFRADLNKADFVKEVTKGLLPPPSYFPENAKLNREEIESFEKVKSRSLQPLNPDEFEKEIAKGATVLDTRSPETFANGYIPSALNIGLEGDFAPWAGTLITDIRQTILLVCENGQEEDAITRLARIGYDQVAGFLKGGIDAWKLAGENMENITSVSPEEFAGRYKQQDVDVADVRRPGEYDSGHVKGAVNVPLDYIKEEAKQKIPQEKPVYIHCAGGYRSMIAASVLKRSGWEHVLNIKKGFKAISEAGVTTE